MGSSIRQRKTRKRTETHSTDGTLQWVQGRNDFATERKTQKTPRTETFHYIATSETRQQKKNARQTRRRGNKKYSNPILRFLNRKIRERFEVSSQQDLNVCYQNRGSLRDCIGSVKVRTPELERAGIYEILCANCIKLYYGQTKRRKDERDKEHDRAIRLNHPDLSAVAKHCLENNHQKGSSKLVKTVDKPWELDAWESPFIHGEKEENLINIGEAPIYSQLFKFAHRN
jgi:hypothetical protein